MQTSTVQFVTKTELKKAARSIEQRTDRTIQAHKENANRITRALNQDFKKTADRLEIKIDTVHTALSTQISELETKIDSVENRINARLDSVVEAILSGVGELLGKPKKGTKSNLA
ncbi:MAG: hypothetical protein U0517_04615 [Candidatus Andersenbacteria bacterium]